MPSAAFTVKHEALHYIETELSPIPRRGILLYSASDGARDGKGWQRLPL